MQEAPKIELGPVQQRLPWLVAAGAFIVYLVTLNHYPTFAGVASLAKAAGWDWRSNVVAPLQVILTYPARWLPAALQLLYLNLTAAIAASAALGLLARSVALLPHDRTREQRALERSDHSLLSIRAAWLPPVLAALVCGLQLTFWENAVVATGEALDLLLIAWLIHTLLRYRLDQKESRLAWFALVYGLAVVNNSAMLAMFPPFLIAVFWIKGMSFFNGRFLLRLTLCGLAGLALYLPLPLVESATDLSGFGFWELLKSYWGYQRDIVLGTPRYIVVISSFTSFVPILFMGVRWPAQFGESSPAGNTLTNLMTHLIHGVFLVACLYVVFDPAFSPRRLSGEALAMLPLYYLGALAIGYCSGYMLLVFGAKPGPQTWQRPSALRRVANLVVLGSVWCALVAVPVGLLVQNLPLIWANNGQAVARSSQHIIESLPPEGAFVLSDDAFRLYALQYELRKRQPDHRHVLVDTSQLVASGYHRFMKRKYPQRWPEFQRPADPRALVDAYTLITLIGQLTSLGKVYYLHPSFGYYFEVFYTKPHGMIYELKPYNDPLAVAPPPLTPQELQEQDKYWDSLGPELEALAGSAAPFKKSAKVRPTPKKLEMYVAEVYSRLLDDFGVLVQRNGAFDLAAKYFTLSLRLNPSNPSAYLNQEFNRAWRNKSYTTYTLSDGARQRLEVLKGRWDGILILSGPVDEPGACIFLAGAFQQGLNFRQSAQNLERVVVFDPDDRTARINCMMMCVKALVPDVARRKLEEFRARFPSSSLKEDEEMDLLSVEAWIRVLKNDLPGAEALLTAAQAKYPKQSAPWDALTDIYIRLELVTNAVAVLSRQLQAQPDNRRALINYGVMATRLNKPAEGLPYLDKALRLDPKDEMALLNRAFANLKLEQLDQAQADLQTLLAAGQTANTIQVTYLLADTFYRKKVRAESLRYYLEFVKKAPPGMPEVKMAHERIKRLKDGAPL